MGFNGKGVVGGVGIGAGGISSNSSVVTSTTATAAAAAAAGMFIVAPLTLTPSNGSSVISGNSATKTKQSAILNSTESLSSPKGHSNKTTSDAESGNELKVETNAINDVAAGDLGNKVENKVVDEVVDEVASQQSVYDVASVRFDLITALDLDVTINAKCRAEATVGQWSGTTHVRSSKLR
jgi:hypothetical protein